MRTLEYSGEERHIALSNALVDMAPGGGGVPVFFSDSKYGIHDEFQ